MQAKMQKQKEEWKSKMEAENYEKICLNRASPCDLGGSLSDVEELSLLLLPAQQSHSQI